MSGFSAAICAALAMWCSLGRLGLANESAASARVGLLAPWWIIPLFTGVFLGLIRALRLSGRERSPLWASILLIMPWLPVPLPAAAMIWTGPCALGIWIAIAACLIVAVVQRKGRPRAAGWTTDPRRAPIAASLVALAIYAFSAVWLSPILPDGDEPHYLILAQSLIKDGDLRIENNHERGDYVGYSLNAAAPDYLRRGVNGEIYSIHAPGLAVLIAPAMLLAGYHGVVAFLALIAALSTGLVWRAAHQATGRVSAAWFAWSACALTTPFLFQATEVFPDGVAATCLLIGTLPLIDDVRPEPTSTRITPWILAGAALAILPWLQTRLAVVAVAAAICLLLRIRRRHEFIAFVAIPVISAAAWFGFFVSVYGTPNPTAPYGSYTQTSFSNLLRGFPGLLFDQQFGLIPNAPVYGFVLIGVLAAAVRRRRWAWEILAIVVPYMAAVGSYQMWWGGTSVPARFLTAITLVSGVAAARVWTEARHSASRAFGACLLMASVFIAALLLVPEHGRLLLNFRDGISLWLEWANPLVDLPKGLPSLFHDGRAQMWLKTAVWVVGAVLFWFALTLTSEPRRDLDGGDAPPVRWTAIVFSACAVMVAFTLAWKIDGANPLTTQTAEIALLQHATPFRSRAVDFRRRTIEEARNVVASLRIATDRQRRSIPPPALLTARDLPAGNYALETDLKPSETAGLIVRVGATPLPFAHLQISGNQPATATIHLATPVRSITVEGDATTHRENPTVTLIPVGVLPSAAGTNATPARRAVHYDSADVFFSDENAYPEPTGLWVAGGRTTSLTLSPRRDHLSLFVRNAPVDNTVTVDVDGEMQELVMHSGEEREVRLKPDATYDNGQVRLKPDATYVIRISSQTGFRPSATEPGSTDLRYLGCWVEIR